MATSSRRDRTSTKGTRGTLGTRGTSGTRGTRGTRGTTGTRGTRIPVARQRAKSWQLSLRKVFGRSWRWASSTITAGGWFLLLVIFLGAVIGYPLGWVELVAPAIVALVLFLLALLFLIGRRKYWVQLYLEHDRTRVGEPLTAFLQVENTGASPALPSVLGVQVGSASIEVAVPMLRPTANFHRPLEIPTEKRGVVPVGPPRYTKTSPIGIVSSDTTWGKARQVFVYPQTVALPRTDVGLLRDLEGIASARIVTDDLAFHAIREYAPGDSQRHIHWKSTAKTGQLMVRQYDETVRSELLLILDNDTSQYLDSQEWELAVSAAASFGLRGLEEGRSLVLSTGPQTESQLYGSVAQALDTRSRRAMMDDFTRVRDMESDVSLRALAASAVKEADAISVAVFITGSQTNLRDVQSAALQLPPEVGALAVRCDVEGKPKVGAVGDVAVVTIALLDDLRQVLLGRTRR